MRRFLISVLCVVGLPSQTLAVPTVSVQDVIELCEAGFGRNGQAPSLARRGTCIAYLDAVIATIAQVGSIAASQTKTPRTLLFCLPKDVSYEELARVYITFGRTNERHAKLAAASLVIAAFSDKYPCR
jgi:hypothetical protein